MADVEVTHCWCFGCFWVKPVSAAAQQWLAAHTPLEPAHIRNAVLLGPEDWKGGAFFVANGIALGMILEGMEASGLSVAVAPLPRNVAAWRKETAEIGELRAEKTMWTFPDVDPDDPRPRNDHGYFVGFAEAMKRYYEKKDAGG